MLFFFDFKQMAGASKSLHDLYEYMDENKIDDELKCTICTQPFTKPVSLSCQHTFCCECIEIWLNEHHSCPTCRQSPLLINEDEKYSPINTHIVNNQLDRLLVRCNQCYEENIQRGNYRDHEEKCEKKFVSCLSSDIECPWKGSRDERELHLTLCPFQQIRPIIDTFRNQLDLSFRIQNEFQEKIDSQTEQINFLLAFINQGNTMNKECLKLYGRCQYSIRNHQTKSKITFHCTVCDNTIRQRYVALHACSSTDHIHCICQNCYEKQYPILDEDNNDNE